MNVLILSNGAPGYYRFFNALARHLAGQGHGVEVAVDCPYSRAANRLDALGAPVHDFAAFFAGFDEDPARALADYADEPLNAALLSDVERAEVYGIGGARPEGYYRRLQAALLRYYERLFADRRIDAVLYENVSNAFAHFAWIVARRRGVAYCGLVGSRLPGRFAIVSDPLGEQALYAPILADIRAGKRAVDPAVRAWCRDYLDNLERIVPDYMKFNNLDNLDLAGRYVNRSKWDKLRLAWRHRGDDHDHAFQVGNPLRLSWRMVRRNLERRLRIGAIRRHYCEPVEGERFLLYPLHFHPESSTSILAGTYLDEYEVIRNIAFSLPPGMTLYVKDHVSAYGYPPRAFYRRLAALPNVRLISPFADTKALIRAARAVITLTSTVGYEALLLGRRVFLFGSVFYQEHPDVVRIGNPAELFDLLRRHLDAPTTADARFNEDFVAAYYLGTFEGVLNFSLGDEAAAALAERVAPQILPRMAELAAEAKAGR